MDAIHQRSEAGLLDGFFYFLDVTGVREEIGAMHLPGQERVLIPLVPMVVLYLLKGRCHGKMRRRGSTA